MTTKLCLALSVCLFFLNKQNFGNELSKEQINFFESKIRPIFVDNCYKCHSVERGKSRGGLTLDTKQGWEKGGESGAVIRPNNPEDSLLITAVTGKDPETIMPPKDENKTLTPEQTSLLEEWIKMGAPDPRTEAAKKLTGLTPEAKAHWAYQKIQNPQIPKVQSTNWGITPIDVFVLSKLEKEGMVPSPLATKETLLRRATYDLLGLPPSPQEIENFLKDQTPDAFSKVIDRLLASPHYGERWGRFWLDTARYSDTSGDRVNNRNDDYRFPYAWTYRDYVIRSFNEDKKYDRFILEQLAADCLSDLKNPKDIAALGFITVGQRSRNKNDIIDDRIDTVTKAFLASTVSCARCHDHKFDPIPTTDYYALHGIFSSIDEPENLPVIYQAEGSVAQDFGSKIKILEDENKNNYYKIASEQNKLFREKAGAYIAASYLAGRTNSVEEQQLSFKLIKEYDLNQEVLRGTRQVLRLHQNLLEPLQDFLDKKPLRKVKTNIVIETFFNESNYSSLESLIGVYNSLFKALDFHGDAYIEFRKNENEEGYNAPYDSQVIELLSIPIKVSPSRILDTDTLQEEIDMWSLGLRNRGWKFAAINELKLTHKGGEARAMVVIDKPKPTNSPVFIRGQQELKGEIVPRRFLEVLADGNPKPYKFGSGRLELAKNIADKNNPLTPRVAVNRIWMHHFGEGLVKTPDDFGTMSSPPTHKELLDYLASYFIDHNWSIKELHKHIMLSKVYQISSYTVTAHELKDPANNLLWRSNVRRLDFESIRDSLLVMSGRLDVSIGGLPVNLVDEPYSYRRSVYGYVDRGNLPELMANFDFSNPQSTNSKRQTTIVPQQALYIMNSPMVVQVSRDIARRPEVVNSIHNLNRIFNVYKIIFQRNPTQNEILLAQQFLGIEMKNEVEVNNESLTMLEKSNKKLEQLKTRQTRDVNNRQSSIFNKNNEFVERKILTPWETWIHSLLMSNEVAYIN